MSIKVSSSTTQFKFNKIDGAVIILGFTGPMGSGCSYLAEALSKVAAAGHKYQYYKLSSIIREILKSEGNSDPSIQQLQDKGNELRRSKGQHFLVAEMLKQIDVEWVKTYPGDHTAIIIDGIKNEGEVRFLQSYPNFYLFSVQAEQEIRLKRLKKITNLSADELEKADARDEAEETDYGQQVKKCNYLADIIILNNENIPHRADKQKREFAARVFDRYVRLIENLVSGFPSPEIAPDVDELCMTVAYVLSKASSCLKRKVGAVVVEQHGSNDNSKIKVTSIPNIVASGYNEVPPGNYKCVFHPDHQLCYRDFLQQEFASGLKHCPECGTVIKLKPKCPSCETEYDRYVKVCSHCHRELNVDYTCDKCQSQVFTTFVPGNKNSLGKLLDMCRSLHAEETALLNLARSSKQGDNLTMYVTTQPCNLCSNKIVSMRIKKVVFSEPYGMKEAVGILEDGGVKLQRFEGVKSSAFFRLYS